MDMDPIRFTSVTSLDADNWLGVLQNGILVRIKLSTKAGGGMPAEFTLERVKLNDPYKIADAPTKK